MGDLTHGYDVSIGYTYGFCREMAPSWLALAAATGGLRLPAVAEGTRPRFLELGCGQGQGLCLLAAANADMDFVGIDFLPEHVAHGRGLAQAAGLGNVRFKQADFVELAGNWPEELGRFDLIALHGVYSWVSAPVRAAVVACLEKAAALGAIVYVGYNAQPGWLATQPFRHLARSVHALSGGTGQQALAETVALFDRLRAGGAATFRILPGLGPRIDSIKSCDASYLVHEYLHESWEPMWHSQVARDLAGADLHFAGTATLAEGLLPGMLPPPLRDAITAQGDPMLRQDVQDFVINQGYRRDIYVRGQVPSLPEPPANLRFVLLSPPADGETVTVATTFGEMELRPQAYRDFVAMLADRPRTFGELAQGRPAGECMQLLALLVHAGILAPAFPQGEGGPALRLNAAIARGVAQGMPYDHLAAPAIGGAIRVGEADLLLLDAWLEGGGDDRVLAAGLRDRMRGLGRTLQRAGRTLEATQAEDEARRLAQAFLSRLPDWRRLGVTA